MVKTEFHEVWKCPNCSHTFDNDDDCYEHIEQTHTDSPYKETKKVHVCEICGEEHELYLSACMCEDDHKEGNDLRYQDHLRKMELLKLEQAGNDPMQKKLF